MKKIISSNATFSLYNQQQQVRVQFDQKNVMPTWAVYNSESGTRNRRPGTDSRFRIGVFIATTWYAT